MSINIMTYIYLCFYVYHDIYLFMVLFNKYHDIYLFMFLFMYIIMGYAHWHLISRVLYANGHVMRQDQFSVANAVVISGGGVLSSLAGGALADKYALYDPRVRLWVSFLSSTSPVSLSLLYLSRSLSLSGHCLSRTPGCRCAVAAL